MDLSRLREAFRASATPLIRTDFGDDIAWQLVVAQVAPPANSEYAAEDGLGADQSTANIVVIDDRAFEGAAAFDILTAARDDRYGGYALLADARSMAEAAGHGDVTVDYVNLSAGRGDYIEDLSINASHTFRVAAAEVAPIEANLAIANLDFDDFADHLDADGVFRGFARTTRHNGEQHPGDVIQAAADRSSQSIGRDLDRRPGARTLSGKLSSITVNATLTGPIDKYFDLMARPDSWWGAVMGSPERHDDDHPYMMWRGDWPSHAITGTAGHIRCQTLLSSPPHSVTLSWNWYLPQKPAELAPPQLSRPLLSDPSTLHIKLDLISEQGDGSIVSITLQHEGFPVEWEDDLRSWWTYRLRKAEEVYRLNR